MDGSRAHARATLLLTALVCSAALTAGCSATSPRPAEREGPEKAPSVSGAPTIRGSAGDLQAAYEKVVKDVLPSVVQITAGDSLGSGVVYDDKGNIVTNAHVVGSAQSFKVTLATGGGPVGARLVSSYPEQDLAVIRLDEVPRNLKPAAFGDSSKVEVGQIVLAMGNPLGLSSSVTQGIVSAVGRTVSSGRSGGGTGATIANMVQTSAAINPGNSGGALVNLAGQVIGIPTLAATDPELGRGPAPGIGFAIPAATVRTVAGQIVKSGRVTDSGRAALGITGRTIIGPDFTPAGVAVVAVTQGGPADRAGLRAGDVITAVGGNGISTMQSLSEALAGLKPGERTEVTYDRDGTEHTTTVTLGEI
ncbi:S1C family serine protease [Streptomyces telluris]|uniref:Trypsin-like peptidase domain-containing protein n=1 Tax=Streptomyces telluris TaxID=2720021 RepID=A0A9X2RQX5_9ACTN|nr:trypsin-like peptidase domain-containing protein [Streptomyces telluris]MCQ8774704.1 trypsin-like peptidase domain-containing protein [Streptomyces telluris]NJP80529.1 PDZ domain-containing protein [Streptomyces telluris]